MDPVGAVLISLYIVYRWIDLCRQQARGFRVKGIGTQPPECVTVIARSAWAGGVEFRRPCVQ